MTASDQKVTVGDCLPANFSSDSDPVTFFGENEPFHFGNKHKDFLMLPCHCSGATV